MSLSDPLGDMLTRIRNAQHSRHTSCVSPGSKLRASVLEALRREGYIRGYSAEELRPGIQQIRIRRSRSCRASMQGWVCPSCRRRVAC